MKKAHLIFTFFLGVALSFAIVGLFESNRQITKAAPASELHVCPNDCTYAQIQEAVDNAEAEDIIKVASGIYTDLITRPRNDFTNTGVVTQVVFISKTVTIQGGYTTTDWITSDPVRNPTVLDALRKGRVFYITGDISPTIVGLQIANGDANGLGGGFFGDEDAGGGVYAITATLTISDCLIYNNHGGGIGIESTDGGLIQNNTFYSNYGGGLTIEDSDVAVRQNVFRANTGGGVNIFASDSEVYGNLVTENSNDNGGGMSLGMFGGTLDRNIIISNTANGNGGGISVMGSGAWHNNVLADNHAGGSGGALFIRPVGPELVHTTIARNSSGDGSAIYVTSGPIPFNADVTLVNTIFVSHSVGISVTSGHTVTVDTVLWHNTPLKVAPGSNVTLNNEMNGDPAFTADGYHLSAYSAAIDWGLDVGVTEDIDLEPRPAGTGYDLGADEFWSKVFLPLTIRNGP